MRTAYASHGMVLSAVMCILVEKGAQGWVVFSQCTACASGLVLMPVLAVQAHRTYTDAQQAAQGSWLACCGTSLF